MLKNKSTTFKAFFLAEFAKQLIENSKTEEVLALERLKKESLKQKIQKSKTINQPQIPTKKIILKPLKRNPQQIKQTNQQNIFPTKQSSIQNDYSPKINSPQKLNLGKIQPLISNQAIKSIECPGPNQKIRIQQSQEQKTTNITLTQNEIKSIINEFSKKSNTPMQETGIIKVSVGNLMIQGILSDFAEPRFVIYKII